MISYANFDLPKGFRGGSDFFDDLIILKTEFFEVPSVISSSLKRWNGTEWVSVNILRYNGTSWLPVEAKRYNGTAWA